MSRALLTAALSATLVAACALVATSARDARADTPPSPWDSARDPAAVDRWALHVHVRELLIRERISQLPSLAMARRPTLQGARVLLEDADAAHSPDPRLRFDLGEVYDRLHDPLSAIAVLEPALAMAPDAPGAAAASTVLAQSYAHLDRSADERRLYERILPRLTEDRGTASTLLNLAEADMHLGDLPASIARYKEAIEVEAPLPNVVLLEDGIYTLAVWGLAVALDRFGDISGGAAQVRLALQLDMGMRIIASRGESSPVFFSPERERFWYIALGFGELARDAPDAGRAAALWHRAEICWAEYVDDARAARGGDRWIDIASDRLTKARAQRAAAEKRAHKAVDHVDRHCLG